MVQKLKSIDSFINTFKKELKNDLESMHMKNIIYDEK